MFHRVRLQVADSPKELAALGLKLKHKRGQHYLLQPCPAFQGTHCSIYASRPERCRLFECRQLQRVNAGKITETMALEKIREVKRRVGQVNHFLGQADEMTDAKKPLMKRCDKALAERLDPKADDEAQKLRSQLILAMQELETMLDEEFRSIRCSGRSETSSSTHPPFFRHTDGLSALASRSSRECSRIVGWLLQEGYWPAQHYLARVRG